MDELVALISQKTGLSPEQARSAAVTVIGFIKDKLPAPLAGHLDSFLNSNSSTTAAEGDATTAPSAGGGGLGDIVGKLGGLLGK